MGKRRLSAQSDGANPVRTWYRTRWFDRHWNVLAGYGVDCGTYRAMLEDVKKFDRNAESSTTGEMPTIQLGLLPLSLTIEVLHGEE